MSEATITQVLSDDLLRFITLSCRNGRDVKELVIAGIAYYRRKTSSSMSDESLMGYVAGRIQSLESTNVIEFREGKWFTTETANKVLEKYFGL